MFRNNDNQSAKSKIIESKRVNSNEIPATEWNQKYKRIASEYNRKDTSDERSLKGYDLIELAIQKTAVIKKGLQK